MENLIRPRILVIDDDEPWREKIFDALERSDYHVEIASNKEDVIRILNRQTFDLAILNILLRREITDSWRFDWTSLVRIIQNKEINVISITSMDKSAGETTKGEIYDLASEHDVKHVFFKSALSWDGLFDKVNRVLNRKDKQQNKNFEIYKKCNLLNLLNLLNEYLLEDDVQDLILELRTLYDHDVFKTSGNLRGDTKKEQLHYLLNVLSTYHGDSICDMCKAVGKIKVQIQKNQLFRSGLLSICMNDNIKQVLITG